MRELGIVLQIHFHQYARAIGADGLDRELHLIGDLRGRSAAGYHAQHREFAI